MIDYKEGSYYWGLLKGEDSYRLFRCEKDKNQFKYFFDVTNEFHYNKNRFDDLQNLNPPANNNTVLLNRLDEKIQGFKKEIKKVEKMKIRLKSL